MSISTICRLVIVVLAFGSVAIVLEDAAAQSAPRSLNSIKSQAEFDSLAVTYDPETPYALPHVLFVIDRQDKNKIYYVNTRRYPFHKDFVNGTYLSLERGQEFFENNYLKPNRRFIMGTVAYQTPLKRWTFEFWEGDLIPADQIKLASEVINKSFFAAGRLQAKFGSPGRGIGVDCRLAARAAKRNLQGPGISGVEPGEGSGPHSHHSQTRRSRGDWLQRNTGAQRSAHSTAARRRDHHDAAFDAACRTSTCWRKVGEFPTRTSRTRRNCSSSTMVIGYGWKQSTISYTIKRADLDELRDYQKRMAERQDLIKPRFDLSARSACSPWRSNARR